jgi:hypothetical protein
MLFAALHESLWHFRTCQGGVTKSLNWRGADIHTRTIRMSFGISRFGRSPPKIGAVDAALMGQRFLAQTRLRPKAKNIPRHNVSHNGALRRLDRRADAGTTWRSSDRGEDLDIASVPIAKETVTCQLVVSEPFPAKVPHDHAAAKMEERRLRLDWNP